MPSPHGPHDRATMGIVRGPVTLRPPVANDAAAIAHVLAAHAAAHGGEAVESAADVRRWFSLPGFDIAADFRIALAGREPVGYADVGVSGGAGWLDVRVVPGAPAAAAEALLTFGEVRAAERLSAGAACRVGARPDDVALVGLLAGGGYHHVRSSYVMERALTDDDLDAGFGVPDGMVLEVPDADDAETIHAVHEAAFAEHWGFHPRTFEEWREWNLGPADEIGLWRMARDRESGEIAGVAIVSRGRGENADTGWIGVLGVLACHRRRGLGESLLRASFAGLRAAGQARVALGVDAANATGAVGLYERVGMRVASRFDTWERAVGEPPARGVADGARGAPTPL